MFNDTSIFIIPTIFAKHYFCQTIPRSLLSILCASQLGEHTVTSSILGPGVKRTGCVYSQTVEHCTRL